MGNYLIVVCGAGPHDNNKAYDVEQMTARFVADLQARGHSVADVHICIGSPKRVQKDLNPQPLPPMADALEDLDRDARAGYERYFASANGKTFDGRPMPDWEQLTPLVQEHWRAALDFYNVTKQREVHVVGEAIEPEVTTPGEMPRDANPPADATLTPVAPSSTEEPK